MMEVVVLLLPAFTVRFPVTVGETEAIAALFSASRRSFGPATTYKAPSPGVTFSTQLLSPPAPGTSVAEPVVNTSYR